LDATVDALPDPNLDVLVGRDARAVTPDTPVPSKRLLSGQTLASSAAQVPTRTRKARNVIGLTGREYHVLCILNCYGWCTPEMVRRIANFHRILWTQEGKLIYRLLFRLKESGYAVSRRLYETTSTIAYAATPAGMAYLRGSGDDLLCDTNAIKDPASLFHFVGQNRIMLQFVSEFPTRYWMSDFQVRSDNSFVGAVGLAKDYDSVGELVLPTGHVRFAVEYERWQQSSSRYRKLCACLESEKYLNMVIFFLDRPKLLNSIAPHFKRLGGFVCFVDYDQFLTKGASARANYWHIDRLFEAPLRSLLDHHSRKKILSYEPVHQLDLRFQRSL